MTYDDGVRAGDLFTLPELRDLEHHLLVFVPCWRLRDAHALLLARGQGRRMDVATGYLDVLRRATVVDAG